MQPQGHSDTRGFDDPQENGQCPLEVVWTSQESGQYIRRVLTLRSVVTLRDVVTLVKVLW